MGLRRRDVRREPLRGRDRPVRRGPRDRRGHRAPPGRARDGALGRLAPTGPADDPRRTHGRGAGVLRGADPGPRALRLPILRARRDPAGGLAALARRLPAPHDRDLREHVRGPDDALPARRPGDEPRPRLAGDRRPPPVAARGHDRRAPAHGDRGVGLGPAASRGPCAARIGGRQRGPAGAARGAETGRAAGAR